LISTQNVLEPASLEIEVMWFVDNVNVLSETFQVGLTNSFRGTLSPDQIFDFFSLGPKVFEFEDFLGG
jgi:hypothetical protein